MRTRSKPVVVTEPGQEPVEVPDPNGRLVFWAMTRLHGAVRLDGRVLPEGTVIRDEYVGMEVELPHVFRLKPDGTRGPQVTWDNEPIN